MNRRGSMCLTVALAACAGCGAEIDPGTRVRGRLTDAETGRPVARTTIWVHAIDDGTNEQESLAPSAATDFALTLGGVSIDGRRIRLRVPDLSNTYELYEQTFEEQDGVVDFDVRLKPTHWVRLHGRVLWREGGTLRPIEDGDANVRSARISAGRAGLDPASDGSYSVRAPRELLKVMLVNTSCHAVPEAIDLAGVKGDEFEQDVILEK